MGIVTIRPRIHRENPIASNGLQIGARGDRWEEEFIKNVDFSTMDNSTDWSYLFRDSKAYNFDLSGLDSSAVTNMDYMFLGTHAGTLSLDGLTIGANTSAVNLLGGSFDAIDFTGAKFYSLPANMFTGASVAQGLQLRTLDVSNLTSLAGMFKNAQLSSLNLTGFDTHTITDMHEMFQGATIPIFIGINTLDYSNVTDASYMFAYSVIPSVDLSGITFTVLGNAQSMFYAQTDDQAKFVDLSDSKFPALINASYMFYSSSNNAHYYNDPPSANRVLTLDLTNMEITSSQLNAYYMFAYLYEPDGLDLSCFDGVKIVDGKRMFYYSILGETDFTMLDFSEAGEWISNIYTGNNPFYNCYTPVIHIKTGFPYAVNSYNNEPLTYYNKATDVILELTTPSTTGELNSFIYPQSHSSIYNTSYLFKNSELYASQFNYFLNSSSSAPINVTFEDTTLHIANDGGATNFICFSNGGVVDMRDAIVDGTFNSSNYFYFVRCSNYSEVDKIVYFPNTGMKFKGQLNYFLYNSSGSNPNVYMTLYNVDKFDVSEIQTMSYVFYGVKGNYDLRSWDVSNLQQVEYCIYNCQGNFDLSGWDTSSLNYIGYFIQNFSGNLNISNWDVSNVTSISYLGSGWSGNFDIRNWKLNNLTSLNGINSVVTGTTIDFDGWEIQSNQNMSNCYLLNVSCYGDTDVVCTIYMPDTLHQPNSYTGTMFDGSNPSIYHAGVSIIDVYTNATSVETQGWKFYHIYTNEEPYGYRLHLGTTHNDFLQAIGGD